MSQPLVLRCLLIVAATWPLAACRSVAQIDTVAHRPSAPAMPGAAVHTRDDTVSQAAALYRTGQLDAARRSLHQARRKARLEPDGYELEAQIAFDRGDRAGHLQVLREGLIAHPRSASLQNAAGRAFHRAGENEQALAALQAAVRLEPARAAYAKDLAGFCLARDDVSTAEAVLVQALHRNPHDRSLPPALARVHEQAGNWRGALAGYEAALRHAPDHPVWLRQRARCLYFEENYRAACDAFAGCLDRDPAVSLAEHVQCADACLHVGEYAQARRSVEEIARRSPVLLRDVEILRGICAMRQGDPAAAGRALSAALHHWPEDEHVPQLLTRVLPAVWEEARDPQETGWKRTAPRDVAPSPAEPDEFQTPVPE